MHEGGLGPKIILSFGDGKFFVTETVFFGLIVAAIIAVTLIWLASGLQRVPTKKQAVAEFIVEFVYNLTRNAMGQANMAFAPYVGTIMLFILMGNALGLFGFRPTTADVNMTFALSTITFFLIEFNSWRSMGVGRKLKHMCEPYPFMFPLKIIESVSRPISLGFRLFGNIFGGVVVMELIFGGLATLSGKLHFPIPFLQAFFPLPANVFFDMFEPVVQAFIFTMLTMVFISIEVIRHGEAEHH